MPTFKSLRARTGLQLALIAGVLSAGLWMCNASMDALWDRNAERTAMQWADTFIAQDGPIETILEGRPLVAEDKRLLSTIETVGDVFRFKVYRPDGRLMLVSDDMDSTADHGSLVAHNPAVAAIVLAGQAFTNTKDGRAAPNRPDLYTEAYVPVWRDGALHAVVEVYVDQTEAAAAYRSAHHFTIAVAVALAALAGLHTLLNARLIAQRHAANERMRYMAHHDGLTDLANRRSFQEALEATIAEARSPDRLAAVMMLDLDGFKDVNDSHGHDVGDTLLCRVADGLKACVRQHDLVARLGGDEFAVVQRGLRSMDEARGLADRLVASVAAIGEVDGLPIRIGASLGIAPILGEPIDPELVLKRADVALYRAKNAGKNRAVLFGDDRSAGRPNDGMATGQTGARAKAA